MLSLPTPDEISRRFYGAPPLIDETGPRASRSELTATAKYVVREAKKLIVQQDLDPSATQLEEIELLKLIQHVEQSQGENLSELERTAVVAALSASFRIPTSTI
jgi:hypothetical protein